MRSFLAFSCLHWKRTYSMNTQPSKPTAIKPMRAMLGGRNISISVPLTARIALFEMCALYIDA